MRSGERTNKDFTRRFEHLITTVGKSYPKAWIVGKTLEQITMPVERIKAIREAHNRRKK